MRDNETDADKVRSATEERERMCIVGIGASAGGLEAIREMLTEASPESNLAYVVVQHLDPNHESLLAELLGRHTALNVRQVAGGEKIEPGNVYIIPPGHGLSVTNGVLQTTEFSQPRGLRRPIDDFFESLAIDQGRFAACVILSGTGADGSAGLRAIKEHGGLCIVQDPSTAKYDGMPTSAQSTGLVDFVRAPSGIIEAIRQFYAHTLVDTADQQLKQTVEQSINDICGVVRNFVGHDFSGYKQSTLVRRVQRRIQVLDLGDASAYLQHIRSDPDECETLFRELLINVTRFFRDSDHFDALREHAVRPLVRNAGNQDEIRVWVPGCSSGEEAYSIAMMFAEEVRLQRRSVNIQIFATDIDEQMLRLAREAIYPQAALADIPEEMRELYTIARDGKFQVSAKIRDMIRFSVHSIVRDPPFSNIDLLSCRNLLIYFGDQLQASALPIFHYAIRPGGLLFLGPSETVGRYDHMFHAVDQSARIFQRNDSRPEYPLHLRGQTSTGSTARRSTRERDAPSTRVEWSDGGAAERVLAAYAPPTLQVSAKGEILRSTGRLGKYLDVTLGEDGSKFAPSVARPGAREAVSAIIRQVTKSGKRTISRDLTAQSEFGRQAFDLVADPLDDGSILLVFRERDRFEALDDDEFEEVDPSDSHVQSLEDELRSTRQRLHTTVEELETANEELKSSNEEMMSMNEELQSTNEELSTVNDELKGKVDELSIANADLSNFFASTALPLVVVDADMAIRNFTDAIQSIYPFRGTDRGRPLAEVTSTLRGNEEVLGAIRDVMTTGEVRHLRVSDRAEDRTWSLVVTPYRTREGQLDGATLVFNELTDALRLEEALRHEGERLRLALDVTGLGVWECDPEAQTVRLDDTAARMLGIDETTATFDTFLRNMPQVDRDRVAAELDKVTANGEGIEVTCMVEGPDGESRAVQMVGHRVESNRAARILGVLFDVTAEHEARHVREMMLREMNHRVKNMFSIISGMVRMAGRTTDSVPDLIESIENRVTALARSHDLTQRAPSDGNLTLEDVVSASLEPYAGNAAVRITGPKVTVGTRDLTALSLLLHEWATNAAKYGVLGPLDGRLDVTWETVDDGVVELAWNEIYAAPIEPEDGPSGFGSTLVQLSAAQLRGSVSVDPGERERRTVLTYEPQTET
ncbi:chemotaxis protein CheB [Roseivivax halodurans JCM 10272]|uniref:Chemotaxis protein CheB n=1 Tax=Roseivivax halodurans JCM 10272 TaxID=1449350 RepID=X7EKZ6_9RHOB|nr:chemotaxis protein CheB [Roseivivax halodurans]ETX16592.1 chemotaxis protein CheB [Roseivivax halodurans JCM 10272]